MWCVFYLTTAVAVIAVFSRRNHPAMSAAAFGLFLVFVFMQSWLFEKSGVSTHPTLQRFAATIHAQLKPETVIGIGSHDLHEKEFQVYFYDQMVQRVGNNEDSVTLWGLRQLLEKNPDVFCLVIKNDYDKFREMYDKNNCMVVGEELMIRKRWHLDSKFVGALLKLDRERIDSYFKEKVYLVHKSGHV